MMRKKIKKAFTLVVIAILAILATVSIVGYNSFTNKAKQSADEQAVTQLNIALEALEKTDGVPVNPSDAMKVLEDTGFNVENYTALKSDNTFYWDKNTNRILIYQGEKGKGTVVYPNELKEKYNGTSEVLYYWYELSSAYRTVIYDTTKSFAENIDSLTGEKTIQLVENESVVFSILKNKNISIDLNGYTLSHTISETVTLDSAESIIIRNGNIKFADVPFTTKANFNIKAGSSLTLENVIVSSNGSPLYPQGDAAQVNVINSTINAKAYCVATNAGEVDNYNVIINLENSTFISDSIDGDNCPVMINVPGTLNMKNCTVIGGRQGVIVRGGIAKIENCNIETKWTYPNSELYLNDVWGSGNEVPMAALVVGNRSNNNSYPYTTSCTLINTAIKSNGHKDIYMWSNNTDNLKAQLTYNDKTTFSSIEGKGGNYCYINGIKQ